MRINPMIRFAASLLITVSFIGTSIVAGAQSSAEYLPGFAAPLAIDTGTAGLWQSLQKLHTRASIIAIVAHPDDEDGDMLAYESRSQGADATLLPWKPLKVYARVPFARIGEKARAVIQPIIVS